jgi:hypothetical protein
MGCPSAPRGGGDVKWSRRSGGKRFFSFFAAIDLSAYRSCWNMSGLHGLPFTLSSGRSMAWNWLR